ncbi:MAG: 5,6-dimethylbenzimidazole synthase [Planctomycetota bacterium]
MPSHWEAVLLNGDIHEQVHGGMDYRQLEKSGKRPEQILDLSSNVLAVEHPKSVGNAIVNAGFSSYPDRDSNELIQRLAERHSVGSERILVGNGCCELIHLLASSILDRGRRVLILEPTFSEYRRASEIACAEIESCFVSPSDMESGWSSELSKCLERRRIDFVWVCNPNNPTGTSLNREELERLVRRNRETIFAIDESYIEFANATQSVSDSNLDNLICLRSLTKSHALAGVRLGYLIGPEKIVQLLKSRRVPWSVSSVAQTLGVAVLDAQPHYDQAIEEMRTCRRRLREALERRGLSPLESDTNFLLLPVANAEGFCERLIDNDILVRACESFGLKGYVRISVGNHDSIDRLLAVLDEETCSTVSEGPRQSRDGALSDGVSRDGVSSVGTSKEWGSEFRRQLNDLFRLRRDVRKFRTDSIPTGFVERWIDSACLAPSVGLSEPWRFVSVKDASFRSEISSEFEKQNALAAGDYRDAEKDHYIRLKLAGIREAPEQLAVFVVPTPEQGKGLGRRTMPETVEYSVVAAIQNFWLAARAEGVGIGWVSILRSERVNEILAVPDDWQLIAYLCIGYPVESVSDTPSLEKEGWERRSKRGQVWTTV